MQYIAEFSLHTHSRTRYFLSPSQTLCVYTDEKQTVCLTVTVTYAYLHIRSVSVVWRENNAYMNARRRANSQTLCITYLHMCTQYMNVCVCVRVSQWSLCVFVRSVTYFFLLLCRILATRS